ncbi:MAG: hypothetical protein IKP53_02940 [Candidatus Methanomethylophilaceae archaeon]|nr:hypothetical protein [Candidatus Methanomethylophilaceae archaeon]MBR7006226.1 hypothetical protein [Candidatus Methanomethylophilaceae archaeon]
MIPIGVASMSFTWLIPAAPIDRTWSGRSDSDTRASSAGTRLSRTMVVFPLPDIPVTTVRRPFGILTSSGFTVWMPDVRISIIPSENSPSFGALERSPRPSPPRKGPILDEGSLERASTVPCAMTLPPSSPAPGPSSTTQSERLRTWVS